MNKEESISVTDALINAMESCDSCNKVLVLLVRPNEHGESFELIENTVSLAEAVYFLETMKIELINRSRIRNGE